MRVFVIIITIFFSFTLLGCEDSRRVKLQTGVNYIKNLLEEVGRNPLATTAFESNFEMGGTIMNYIAANLPDSKDFPPFEAGRPSKPWTVVIRGSINTQEFIIEGYGEDLNKPLIIEKVTIGVEVGRSEGQK